MKPAVKKDRQKKDVSVSKVEDRRQGIGAEEKKVRNKCRRKGEGIPKRGVCVAYTLWR